MGDLPKDPSADADAEAVDISAEGTLVWLRRPNGTWWPSIVISPLDVPDGCPAPPRCPAVPIMLLGRRDGTTYVDWCNLGRCKRVKPFRCGDHDFDRRISNAQALAASRIHHKRRYARMEDAILQALEIERARAPHPEDNPNLGNAAPTAIHPPSPQRKRKTPNDSEDDAPPKGSRRMRDLNDIGSKVTVPATDLPALTYHHLPSDNQAKRTHATTKGKYATADHDQPCGTSRKKDRSRPLSELCNGDILNGFRPNAQISNGHLLPVATSSSGSSGTSSLTASLYKTRSYRSGTFKSDQQETSCMAGLLTDAFPHGDDFVENTLNARGILQSDHLQTYQPCASPNYPTWKHSNQDTDYSKAGRWFQCDRGNFKVKTTSAIDHEGNNRTREALEHDHRKARTVKHKAPRNEVVLLENKPDRHALNKPSEAGVNMNIAAIPGALDCVGTVQQQHSERKRSREESLETMSDSSNCGSASSQVFELQPLRVLPPEHTALDLESCRAVKPIKTLQLNSALYDVELSANGCSSKGRRVPLVSLMSKWNHKPVVGYPVSVEVSDDVFQCLVSDTNDHKPATSVVNGLLNKDKAEGLLCLAPPSHACRAKPKSRKKTSGKEVDKLWQPHKKKPASSPRKMRRLSSFASSQGDGVDRKSAVGKVSGPAIACIPLRVVFSRIKEALSYPGK